MDEYNKLASALGDALRARGWRLATAESCTGGGIAVALTDVPGSSEWFDRSFVTYSNQAKQDMLGVQGRTLEENGAVSEATVREMAEGALQRAGVELSVAVSGIAGPGGGSPAKPVGTVWLAWAGEGLETRAECFHFEGDRTAVRDQAIRAGLQGLIDSLG